MAEPLKNHFGPDVPRRIAARISAAHRPFPAAAFLSDALDGYEALELLPRARRIAAALGRHLPQDFERAADVIVASLGPKLPESGADGMGPFQYLPDVFFVSERGLPHFEASMRAQYELTQRFTAEFSIRAFLEHETSRTLARLAEWTGDPSPHVRRLVSEGTRPRLPWAPRLRAFQADPQPGLRLLELLKDDPSEYVRRSVANHLNDIGKDHPEVLVATCRRWMEGADDARRRLVRHALRTAVKRGDPGALAILGFGRAARVTVGRAEFVPRRARLGGDVGISFDVRSTAARTQRLLVDFRVHFVKANGTASPKVFKLGEFELAPRATERMACRVSLRPMTTRRLHPGRHRVDVLVNGAVHPIGAFDVPVPGVPGRGRRGGVKATARATRRPS